MFQQLKKGKKHMIITNLLESLMGKDAEFEQIKIFLPVDSLVEARDLAGQIGVPVSRLLAELLPEALREARTEWRALTVGSGESRHPAQAPVARFTLSHRVK